MESTHPLRRIRRRLKLTQEQLAAKAKVTQPLISRIEKGQGVGREAAIAIWEAVGRKVSLAVLLGVSDSTR